MRLTRWWMAGLMVCALGHAAAQAGIEEVKSERQWFLHSGESTYVIGVDESDMLETLYWGPKLEKGAALPAAHSEGGRGGVEGPINTTPLEYPAQGAGLFAEPALKVTSPNGDRTLVLLFDSASVSGKTLEITLHDKVQPIRVHLFYEVFPEGVLARWSRIENLGTAAFHIEQAESATLNLPPRTDYELSWLTGQWAGEWQLHTEPIREGARVIESRRGSTGHQANPWFSIDRAGVTTESDGPVWFGELGWSGSWRLAVEQTGLQHVRITAGYNPYDFAWLLEPGTSLETPKFYAGYSSHGHAEASRILHRFQLAEILPMGPNPRPRPVIYNSWEATEFNVNEPGQVALAEKAAQLGVERFVMDDGWFGKRNNDKAGLGDWYVNKDKFPNGLKPLIDHVHALGMSFGLWVEPEMVNPDSDLYRAHPDWAMHFPDRQRTEGRHQLMLNLARKDVADYVYAFLDKLVTENDIAFLKWDYNRNWSEPGWPEMLDAQGKPATVEEQKEIYVRYIQNLYDILARLRAKHPKLEIESCSGGGGRVDLGILRFTDEVWPSDNTDALDRLSIQDGYTHAYTPQTMVAWVTDVPNFLDHRTVPLQFRFLVAMQGALGIGGDLNKWSTEDLALATRLTAFYKDVRTTVQHGKLFRLVRPESNKEESNEDTHIEYVAQDGSQAVLFSYLHSQRNGMALPRVQLQGLDPAAMYRVRPLDPAKYTGATTVSGSVLMGYGVQPRLRGDYDSTAIILERVGRSESH